MGFVTTKLQYRQC